MVHAPNAVSDQPDGQVPSTSDDPTSRPPTLVPAVHDASSLLVLLMLRRIMTGAGSSLAASPNGDIVDQISRRIRKRIAVQIASGHPIPDSTSQYVR